MAEQVNGLHYAYLTYVSGQDTNNNKFYEMKQVDETFFEATWGRICNTRKPQSQRYPMYTWFKKLREKLDKGYDDITHLKVVKQGAGGFLPDPSPGGQLLARLMEESRQLVKQNYAVAIANVTATMLAEANTVLNELPELPTVYLVNRQLEQLFRVLPREMPQVSDYLIDALPQVPVVIQRERDILDALETQVQAQGNGEQTLAQMFGLTLTRENDGAVVSELARLLGCAPSRLAVQQYQGGVFAPVRAVYRVDQPFQTERLQQFTMAVGTHSQGKMLWHGSRNENWASILKLGLRIRPSNAHQTGAMFGEGIYFAPRAMKSANYTSYSGSYWARGQASYAVLALYEVNIGQPYIVQPGQDLKSWMAHCSAQRLADQGCYHALWAREGMNYGGRRLLNDEIVVYRDDQFTPRFLLELGGN